MEKRNTIINNHTNMNLIYRFLSCENAIEVCLDFLAKLIYFTIHTVKFLSILPLFLFEQFVFRVPKVFWDVQYTVCSYYSINSIRLLQLFHEGRPSPNWKPQRYSVLLFLNSFNMKCPEGSLCLMYTRL